LSLLDETGIVYYVYYTLRRLQRRRNSKCSFHALTAEIYWLKDFARLEKLIGDSRAAYLMGSLSGEICDTQRNGGIGFRSSSIPRGETL
jgi:hypothetical protein